jgi:hypothetical protein
MNGKFISRLILVGVLVFIPFRWSNAQAPAAGVGRIKGVLTYFFNANDGSKTDVGSEIWLIEGHAIEIHECEIFTAFMTGAHVLKVDDKGHGQSIADTTRFKVVKHTVADGNGNYELSDVPAGKYTLVMKSSHSKGSCPRDMDGKIKLTMVDVKTSETVDASTDFGMSAFKGLTPDTNVFLQCAAAKEK